MIDDQQYEKHKPLLLKALHRENRRRAIERVMEDGIKEPDAEWLVDKAMDEIRQENRSIGGWMLAVGAVVMVAVLVVLFSADRFFYILFFVALFTMIGGAVHAICPSRFRLLTHMLDRDEE